jgi:hypothetical protein
MQEFLKNTNLYDPIPEFREKIAGISTIQAEFRRSQWSVAALYLLFLNFVKII